MPYKRVGRKVFVKKSGRWKLLKVHHNCPGVPRDTVDKAKKHLAALRINLEK